MPRTLNITVPPEQTADILKEIQGLSGIIGIRLQKGVSIKPPGDVISLEILNSSVHALMHRLAAREVATTSASSVTSSEPDSIASQPLMNEIATDESEAFWEEMEFALGKEGNMTRNGMILMFLAGILAAVGIATGALHIVIGAMIIAPGFEPIVRVALGAIVRGIAWRRGILDFVKGYGAMAIGAALASALLVLSGTDPVGGQDSYLESGKLVAYWTNPSFSSILIAFAAGVAGAFVLIANRSVLTAGVMLALALVPTATMTGIAIALGEWNLAGASAWRWLIEVAVVLTSSFSVFAWRRYSKGRRFLLTVSPDKR